MVRSSRRGLPSARELLEWTLNTLSKYNVKLRRRLSQNFLVDPGLIDEFLSHLEPSDDIVEIGCGIGTLTRFLTTRARRVTCVELDPYLSMITSEEISDSRVIVVNADALTFSLGIDVVVSNVPYHITSELLVKIARENTVKKAILTLQYEVAERLLAEPGSKKYGRITILIRNIFDIERGGVYPPSSFYPRPEVYSQVVILRRRRQYDEVMKTLEEVTRILFNQRRKIVDKVVEEKLGIKLDHLGEIGREISGKRIYSIPPETWLRIAERLVNQGVI